MNGAMNGLLWVIDQLGQECARDKQTIAQLRAEVDQLQAQLAESKEGEQAQ